ncbi:MAG: zinc ribbon domain-containing protein [Chloroflexi bacterium]|nr:zinc ribbon domain-containing protein [Chloroflexota bacterium]
MPLYEFDCPGCGQPFEKLVRSAAAVNDVVCPNCGNPRPRKKLSTFAMKGSSSGSSSAGSSCSTGL